MDTSRSAREGLRDHQVEIDALVRTDRRFWAVGAERIDARRSAVASTAEKDVTRVAAVAGPFVALSVRTVAAAPVPPRPQRWPIGSQGVGAHRAETDAWPRYPDRRPMVMSTSSPSSRHGFRGQATDWSL